MNAITALYARVSSERQEQERTIDSQLAALGDLARTRGWEVPPSLVYRDEGYSGSRLDRPGLDALRDAASEGKVARLVVYCPDRLARNYVHQQILLEELQHRGVEVHFVERPITDRPEDKLLIQMQGVIAEYERTKILERTRRGRLYKARMGLWLNWGTPPYGYRMLPREKNAPMTPVVEETEASWVRQIFAWVAEEGLSGRQVARRLNRLGVPPRRAKRWNCSTVCSLLSNPAYAGTTYYNRTETVEPKRRRHPGRYYRMAKGTHKLRPREEWIAIAVPALVSAESQVRALAQLQRNRWTSIRNTRHLYLLRTLVVCGECGRHMNAITEHARAGSHRYTYLYYMCPCSERNPEETGREYPCPAHRVRADRLDPAVWESLSAWLQRPELLRKEMELYLRDVDTSTRGETAEKDRGMRRQRELERQGRRLWDAYQAGLLPLEELRARRERIETEANQVKERLTAIEGVHQQRLRVEEVFKGVDAFCQKLREGLERLDFEGRQRVVRLLVERVVVKEADVTVEHVVPLTGRFSELRPDGRVGVEPPEEPRARELRAPRCAGAEPRAPSGGGPNASSAEADPLLHRRHPPL